MVARHDFTDIEETENEGSRRAREQAESRNKMQGAEYELFEQEDEKKVAPSAASFVSTSLAAVAAAVFAVAF